jgi:hypothetical protein
VSSRHRNNNSETLGRIANWVRTVVAGRPKKIPALTLLSQSEPVSVDTVNSRSTLGTTPRTRIPASEPSAGRPAHVLVSVPAEGERSAAPYPPWALLISSPPDRLGVAARSVDLWARCSSAILSWIQMVVVPTNFTSMTMQQDRQADNDVHDRS